MGSTSPPAASAPWITRAGRASWSFVGISLAVTIVIVAFAALGELVIPFIVATVSAVNFVPVVNWLERRGLARAAGALAVVALICALAAGIVALVAVGVVQHAGELGSRLDQAWGDLADRIDTPAISDYLDGLRTDFDGPTALLGSGVGRWVGSLLDSAVAAVSGLVLALVILYYLLKDGSSMVEATIARRAPAEREQLMRMLGHAARTLRARALGRTILAAIQGGFMLLLLSIFDVPLAATIAIVNFIGSFVPYLAAFVGGGFAVLIALADEGLSIALIVLAGVLFMNLVLENLLEPRLVGSTMHMRPLVVLLSTVAGGLVAGMLGVVLGAPVYAIATNVIRELRAAGVFGAPVAGPVATVVGEG